MVPCTQSITIKLTSHVVEAVDATSDAKGCLRSTVLVVHVSDKQSHYLIEALTNKREDEWTWTMCTWVKESGSARQQGPRMRYDTEHWFYCWRKKFNPKINYDTKDDDER